MVHGADGEHMEYVVSHVEEVPKSVKGNARIQHLHMEDEIVLDQIQIQQLAMSIYVQVSVAFSRIMHL